MIIIADKQSEDKIIMRSLDLLTKNSLSAAYKLISISDKSSYAMVSKIGTSLQSVTVKTRSALQSVTANIVDYFEKLAKTAAKSNKTESSVEKIGASEDVNKKPSIDGFATASIVLDVMKELAELCFEFVNVANEYTKVQTQLDNAIKLRGGNQLDLDGITHTANVLQDSTTFTRTSLMAGATKFTNQLSNASNVEAMMGTLTDYAAFSSGGAEVSNETMTKYAEELNQMLTGSVDDIIKKGFTVTDAQKEILKSGDEFARITAVSEIINSQAAGLAQAMADTPAGKMQQLKNAFTSIVEEIGMELQPVVMSFVETLQKNMGAIKKYLSYLTTLGSIVIWLMNIVFQLVAAFVDLVLPTTKPRGRITHVDAGGEPYTVDLDAKRSTKIRNHNFRNQKIEAPGVWTQFASDTSVVDALAETAGNTRSMAESLTKSTEELTYLRDIAEKEAINRFTTAEVKIDMSGMTNRIENETDINGLLRTLSDGLNEAYFVGLEGV